MIFFAALQTTVMNALCTRANFVPAQHRVALAIWIDPAGKVTDARVLTSPIADDVSTGIVESVRSASIGQPLPSGLKQPVTFVILARSPERTGECAGPRSGRG
ncbi:energy transducer TonB [Rhodopseudomonas sp. P2A-2r]|uniref:energy transducer TonB family protein n=1 Tax=Rhodopseudomonas sp. P2A-2r TaxID=2991972 RepID=UPI0022346319|nr:energy transducer TonB [Rhodopseudomonas sp. P2A-2r]UZE50511.1 energy transducer TonB [Rhodopseudomonas sp. P2A-2r]